jgi:mannose-6-phosphate isomerase-like protein (cupin superfamily)
MLVPRAEIGLTRWRTLMIASPVPLEPTTATSGFGAVSAAGDALVIREWTDSGPSYLHIHHCDDEAWHVLEGYLRFRFEHGEVDAPAGTTGPEQELLSNTR